MFLYILKIIGDLLVFTLGGIHKVRTLRVRGGGGGGGGGAHHFPYTKSVQGAGI